MNPLRLSRIIGIGIFVLVAMAVASFVRISGPWIGADQVYSADMPAVDYDAIEDLLRRVTASQPIVSLQVIREAQPSPITGLLEVRFTVEVNGQRQNGLVYVSGSRIILGQMLDLGTRQNLTALRAGPPTPIRYSLKDLNMKDRVPRGAPGARVVIVEFSDFQCPYCRQATGPLKELLVKYPQEVVLYYKHLPITESHPYAYSMAMAAECARAQKPDAFWYFHDGFFADPEVKSDTELRDRVMRWAGEKNLNLGRFVTCYDKGEQSSRIESDLEDARKIGVSSTPTFLVNGEFVSGAQPLETFERYLVKE